MELTPNNSEEDKSSNKDDDKLSKKKKTTKIARRMPLGISLHTEESGQEKPRPTLSISERLMLQLQERAANQDDKVKPAEEKTEESKTDTKLGQSEFDSADWETEIELNDNAEINLNRPESSFIENIETAENRSEVVNSEVEDDVQAIGQERIDQDLIDSGLASEANPETDTENDDDQNQVTTHYSRSAAGGLPWYNANVINQQPHNQNQVANTPTHNTLNSRSGLLFGEGTLLGWVFGRRSKKELEKKHKKDIKIKDKEIAALKKEQVVARQRINAIKSTQDQLKQTIREQTEKASFERQEDQNKISELDHLVNDKNEKDQKKSLKKLANVGAATIGVSEKEAYRSKKDTNYKPTNYEKLKASEAKQKKELPPEEREITEDTYNISEGTKVEASAWHRIEIDKSTGKVVQNPEVAYGEEFKREQRQEVKRDDLATKGLSGSAGLLGGLATSSAGSNAYSEDSISNKKSADGSLFMSPKDLDNKTSKQNDLSKHMVSPLIWVVAVIVVVALFVFGMLR